MEHNLSQKADEVIGAQASKSKLGTFTMPRIPQKSFFKKPVFIVLLLIILLIILGSIFTLLNIGRFEKVSPYQKKLPTEAEYKAYVDGLKEDGFFETAQLSSEELKKAQNAFESDPRFQTTPSATPESRQQLLNSGTPGVVQE
jgi:hypothetical protein